MIDHGHNDLYTNPVDCGSLDNRDNRNTFYGAYNMLVDLIRKYSRNIRIVQISHFPASPPNYQPLIAAQKAISKRNGIPFCPLYDIDGWDVDWTQEYQSMIKTCGRWNYRQDEPYASWRWATWEDNVVPEHYMYVTEYHLPDGTHPHSDMSGQQNRELTYAIAGWMRNALGL